MPVGRFHPEDAYIKLKLLLLEYYQNNKETQKGPIVPFTQNSWGRVGKFNCIWTWNLFQHFMWALHGSSKHQGKKQNRGSSCLQKTVAAREVVNSWTTQEASFMLDLQMSSVGGRGGDT